MILCYLKKKVNGELNCQITYKEFIKKYNGASPVKDSFMCNNHSYVLDRFLCILKVTGEKDAEFYDIGVVRTQLEERIVSDENLVGTEILPIAVLFAGDFVCLDSYLNVDPIGSFFLQLEHFTCI